MAKPQPKNALHSAKTENRILWGIGTSRTLRAHWAMIELGLSYQTKPLRTRTPDMEDPDFLEIQPRQKIPVLQDGDLVVSESLAIVTYLAERYASKKYRLIPNSINRRAKYFEWISFIATELDATSLYVLRRHVELFEIYGKAPAAIKTAREYFIRMVASAEISLPNEGDYLLGHDFSGADIMMVSCLNLSDRFNIELPVTIKDYRNRVSARPTYIAALEANSL